MSYNFSPFIRIRAAVGTNGGHCLIGVRLANGR
jgi:hypothetical protein